MRTFLLTLFAILLLTTAAVAQRNVTPAIERDPIMEADAKHNLDVARQAFLPLRKAYKQVILRFDETYAAYPDFSQIDEFLYLAGMSSRYLSQGRGKQKVDLKNEREKEKFTPEKLREDAVRYLTELIDRFPQSKFKPDAEKALETLKGK